ncbi:MAG: glycoside hydrolase, partial [Xanthomonadaceae bacterium]|nr:glycoside hydrolase [Xanthomonadaceae bacterium]
YRGEISGPAENSFTIHPGIVEFKGQWYFFYHNGVLTVGDHAGGLGRRAVAVEHLYYDADGGIVPIEHTREGVSVPRKP